MSRVFNEIKHLHAPVSPCVPSCRGFEPHQPPQETQENLLSTRKQVFLFVLQIHCHFPIRRKLDASKVGTANVLT